MNNQKILNKVPEGNFKSVLIQPNCISWGPTEYRSLADIKRIVELEKELLGYKQVAKERAEFIINGEELGYISLPESENDKAYVTFMRCQLTDEYAAIEALKEPKP